MTGSSVRFTLAAPFLYECLINHVLSVFNGVPVIEQEHLYQNALCDLLMKEGIDGRQDDDAITRTCLLTTLAVDLGRADSLTCALAWHEALEKKGITGEQAIVLDLSRANAIAGNRYGTKWTWDQPTLAREIFHLRRAVSHPAFSQAPDVTKCKCLNNLGSRLRVAGRAIEALEYWRRALEVQPHFGMALCNRARILANYGAALDDPNVSALFMWMAHNEASAALAPTALYTDASDERTKESTKTLTEWIESQIDVAGVSASNPLVFQDTSATEDERNYRRWCLINGLFVNPLNDLGPHTVAASDSMGLAQHVVRVDAPHRFESFYDQMKQEYVSARWLLYEGLTSTPPHFSDRDVLLAATEPKPSLSLAIEKLKAAYRISYSLFDKMGFFVAAYMELGIPEKKITFRTLWRTGENKPIRKEFDLTGNWGFCALYWLAKDFSEKENDEVAEPQARRLSDIRNHIEHKCLRVTATEPLTPPPDDLALMVSRNQFQAKATHLLKLARSALIYLAIGVGLEERRREPSRAGLPIEELPSTPFLSDTEKT
jgi:LA2681-like HEPN